MSERRSNQAERPFSNAEIAQKLASLSQLLAAQGENIYKVKAYRRAANTISSMPESIEELVRSDGDLTQFAGIGKGISGAIREIVLTGTSRQLEALRQQVSPEVAAISEYPKLDPRHVLRIFKRLKIATVGELKQKLESGEIAAALGPKMAQHVRQALSESHQMLLYHADDLASAIQRYLVEKCRVRKAEIVGTVRRRVEVIEEISFVVDSGDFNSLISTMLHYGGRAELLSADEGQAEFKLGSGMRLSLTKAEVNRWGLSLLLATGSEGHLKKLDASGRLKRVVKSRECFPAEQSVYRALKLPYIAPELREGHDEVDLAAQNKLPSLVTLKDIRGDFHAHTVASDGANTIEEMVAAAKSKGYQYVGISDHSQSLKIAHGLSQEDMWKQIRRIDQLNETQDGIRILKAAEVDILEDGSLDYPDELLRELDYTVCSIHSRFGLGKHEQTERILRAMDNRYFNILGHATGRLLLKRPGYEVEMERLIEHAAKVRCFFEINASIDRLDLSAANARFASQAGVMIAINTDAHSTHEFDFLPYGIDQARRAGIAASSVLNCRKLAELRHLFSR